MNGAESLVRTLVKGGVEVCFANPGTSEMHFVGALDRVEGMRCVLGLFEGVCSGAADGYYRMTRQAGLDAAASRSRPRQRRGQPAQRQEGGLGHRQHRGRARALSHQVRHAAHRRHRRHRAAVLALGEDLADVEDRGERRRAAIQAARVAPGQIATLILPADTAWGEADGVADTPETPPPQKPANEDGRRRRQGAEERPVGDAVHRRPRVARARPRACRQDRRQDRLPGAGGRRHGAHRARRGPRAGAAPALRRRDGAGDAEGHQAHGARAAPRRRPRFSPIPASPAC